MVKGDEYGTELSGAKIARLPETILSWRICCADCAIVLRVDERFP
jgi:hypothetical protein